MSFLKNHPFAVEAFFDHSLVLTFAVPQVQLQPLIPECLSLDTFRDTWAFVAVAMVQTSALRPKGFPKFLGNDFFLTGYRIFVRYTNNNSRRLRGLYILRSETDKKKMEWLGNLFTHYRYTTTDIRRTTDGGLTTFTSAKSDFDVAIAHGDHDSDIPIPDGSPFSDWKEARRFAGPLPHTFTYNPTKKTVLIIEGVRQHWTPRPVRVDRHHFGFLDTLRLQGITLASAFEIKDIPYHWKKGRIEKWK